MAGYSTSPTGEKFRLPTQEDYSKEFERLVVIKDNKLVGIITASDFAKHLGKKTISVSSGQVFDREGGEEIEDDIPQRRVELALEGSEPRLGAEHRVQERHAAAVLEG
jgi:hypothetical protein